MTKYVVVSGRSSHTVTANSKEEASKKFKKLFPYAEQRYISEVPSGSKSMERLK